MTIQVSGIEVAEPTVQQRPHTTKIETRAVEHLLPVITRYPLILQLGGLFPQFTPGPHVTAG